MSFKTNIYFDHNATSVMHSKTREAMLQYLNSNSPCNPSSVHRDGRAAKNLLESTRLKLLQELKADPENYRVIFTSSATEANNIAIFGINKPNIITSAIEHNSVLNRATTTIPVNSDGVILTEALRQILKTTASGSSLVSIMLANNETGVIQPVQEAVTIAKQWQAVTHTDATQAFGRIPIDINELGVDMLTLAVHKVGGPQGVGALVIRKDLLLERGLILGGGQEYRYRPGTHNMIAIVGLNAFCDVVPELIAEHREKVEPLRNFLEILLNARVLGNQTKRLPNTSAILMPEVSSETQVIHCDLAGISVSSGSACSSGSVQFPHTYMAMGLSESEAKKVLRVSLGPSNTIEEINHFANIWHQLQQKYYNGEKRHAS